MFVKGSCFVLQRVWSKVKPWAPRGKGLGRILFSVLAAGLGGAGGKGDDMKASKE
jgi:hypothetical protein